jgi:hypothetical protein
LNDWTTTKQGNPRLLRGINEICQRFGWGKTFFNDLVKLGLPVRQIGKKGIWTAHEDNIEEFMKEITKAGMGNNGQES